MEELFKLIPAIFKQNGLVGLICIFLLWDRLYRPHKARKNEESERDHKKASGEWISWSDLKKRQDDLEKLIQARMIKEAEKDIILGKLQTEMTGMKDKQSSENEHIFSQLKGLHEGLGDLLKMLAERKT